MAVFIVWGWIYLRTTGRSDLYDAIKYKFMTRHICVEPIKGLMAGLLLLLAGHVASGQDANSNREGGSFMVLVGSSATDDGSVMVAYNHEDQQERGSYFLRQYPRTEHDSGQRVIYSNGLAFAQTNITHRWMSLEHDGGYKEDPGVGLNEHQVAIGGWVSLNQDLNERAREADPLVGSGAPAGILPIALQRAHSARNGVQVLGRLFERYGIARPMGIAIADKKELWYMETATGHHWAAVQIPSDAFWVQANTFRIGHIDPDDPEVMASQGLVEFAQSHNLYQPEKEIFDFSEAFGGGVAEDSSTKYTTTRRIWRATSILAPSIEVNPDQEAYPLFVRPQEKITLRNLITTLRDHYEGTPYDTMKQDSSAQKEKAIASSQTAYTSITQLTNGLPANVGGVLWLGLGSPNTTPYIPFYFGLKEIPKPFDAATPDAQKAYQVFHHLSRMYYDQPLKYRDTFPGVWEAFQDKIIREQKEIDQGAMRLYRMDLRMAKHFITVNVEGLGQRALDLAREQLNQEP